MSTALRAVLGLVAALVLGLGAAGCGVRSADPEAPVAATSAAKSSSSSAPKPGPRPGGATTSAPSSSQVPAGVTVTLGHIDAGDWPDAAHAPGTHGGDPFGNREGRLPATGSDGRKVSYREWDVNPKKQGQGRDAERIITGSDGSAWYTLDHYSTFARIR